MRPLIFDFPRQKDTVLLVSSGRSGSTWWQTMIASAAFFRVLFEPFHSQKIELLRRWNYRQYLAKESAHDEFYEAARPSRPNVSSGTCWPGIRC